MILFRPYIILYVIDGIYSVRALLNCLTPEESCALRKVLTGGWVGMTVAAEKGHLKFAILLHEKAVVIPMFGHANIWIRNIRFGISCRR